MSIELRYQHNLGVMLVCGDEGAIVYPQGHVMFYVEGRAVPDAPPKLRRAFQALESELRDLAYLGELSEPSWGDLGGRWMRLQAKLRNF